MTLENKEAVGATLNRYNMIRPRLIPMMLERYLEHVAKTGETVFDYSDIKLLIRDKVVNSLNEFYEHMAPSNEDIPQVPNVDPFNYESVKATLLERLDHFQAAPFTIQRLCELVIEPRKHYNRIDKYMRALEKNILVVSTIEPGRKAVMSDSDEMDWQTERDDLVSRMRLEAGGSGIGENGSSSYVSNYSINMESGRNALKIIHHNSAGGCSSSTTVSSNNRDDEEKMVTASNQDDSDEECDIMEGGRPKTPDEEEDDDDDDSDMDERHLVDVVVEITTEEDEKPTDENVPTDAAAGNSGGEGVPENRDASENGSEQSSEPNNDGDQDGDDKEESSEERDSGSSGSISDEETPNGDADDDDDDDDDEEDKDGDESQPSTSSEEKDDDSNEKDEDEGKDDDESDSDEEPPAKLLKLEWNSDTVMDSTDVRKSPGKKYADETDARNVASTSSAIATHAKPAEKIEEKKDDVVEDDSETHLEQINDTTETVEVVTVVEIDSDDQTNPTDSETATTSRITADEAKADDVGGTADESEIDETKLPHSPIVNMFDPPEQEEEMEEPEEPNAMTL